MTGSAGERAGERRTGRKIERKFSSSPCRVRFIGALSRSPSSTRDHRCRPYGKKTVRASVSRGWVFRADSCAQRRATRVLPHVPRIVISKSLRVFPVIPDDGCFWCHPVDPLGVARGAPNVIWLPPCSRIRVRVLAREAGARSRFRDFGCAISARLARLATRRRSRETNREFSLNVDRKYPLAFVRLPTERHSPIRAHR